MNKRLLVVSYFYAPLRKVATIRWSKLVKYLVRDGWDVDVITTASTGAEDSILAAELPLLGNIIRIPHADKRFEQTGYKANVSAAQMQTQKKSFTRRIKDVILSSGLFRLYNRLVVASRAPMLEDERGEDFAREAEKYLVAHGGVDKYDAVVCTYGPVGDVMLALRLKKRWPDMKLIMDFRDPMVRDTQTPDINRRYGEIQREICDIADSVVSVSKGFAERIRKRDGSPAEVIYNGFDRDDLNGIQSDSDGRFSFCYAGQMYTGLSDLSALFRAFGSAFESGVIDRNDVEVRYAGPHISRVRDQAESYGVSDVVRYVGNIDRRESLTLQRSSMFLILASWNTTTDQGILTAKVHEYMMMDRPVIALVSGNVPDSELRSLISETNLGIVHEEARAESDDAALLDWLVMQYREYKNSGRPLLAPPASELEKYSYAYLAGRYAGLITDVCSADH